jgi:hypothetical protein
MVENGSRRPKVIKKFGKYKNIRCYILEEHNVYSFYVATKYLRHCREETSGWTTRQSGLKSSRRRNFSSLVPGHIQRPPSLLSNGYRALFPGVKVTGV